MSIWSIIIGTLIGICLGYLLAKIKNLQEDINLLTQRQSNDTYEIIKENSKIINKIKSIENFLEKEFSYNK